MKTSIICATLLLALLQYKLWFAQGGLPDLWRLNAAVQQQTARNSLLKERNIALAAEVADLKSGTQAIEEHARNDLGLIKKGETFFQIVKEN